MSERLILMCAGILCSALYLSGAFFAGLVSGNIVAWQCALAAMGICYISYMAQCGFPATYRWQVASGAIAAASIVLGVASGVALLLG